jgi:hypothetical protein
MQDLRRAHTALQKGALEPLPGIPFPRIRIFGRDRLAQSKIVVVFSASRKISWYADGVRLGARK